METEPRPWAPSFFVLLHCCLHHPTPERSISRASTSSFSSPPNLSLHPFSQVCRKADLPSSPETNAFNPSCSRFNRISRFLSTRMYSAAFPRTSSLLHFLHQRFLARRRSLSSLLHFWSSPLSLALLRPIVRFWHLKGRNCHAQRLDYGLKVCAVLTLDGSEMFQAERIWELRWEGMTVAWNGAAWEAGGMGWRRQWYRRGIRQRHRRHWTH